tara:strand:- start:47 stop:1900 length:1854 start_codon:yes stop_codon:yes gene_type:complete
MADDFKALVQQQKETNEKLDNLTEIGLAQAQAQGVQIQEEQNTDAKETEDKREQNRVFKKLLGGISSISEGVGSVASSLAKSAMDSAKKGFSSLLDLGKKFLFGAALAAGLAFLNSPYWDKTIKFIKETLVPAIKFLYENVIKPLGQVLKDVFIKQWENIKLLFDDLGESIKLFKEGKYLEGITTLIKGLGTFFLNTIDNAITGVYNLFAKMFGFEESESIFQDIKDMVAKIGKWFTDKFVFLGDTIGGLWTSATDWVGEKWDMIYDWFVGKLTFHADNIGAAWTNLTDFVSGIWSKITGWFSDKLSWASDKAAAVKEGAQEGWNNITDFVGGKWSSVKGFFSKQLDNIVPDTEAEKGTIGKLIGDSAAGASAYFNKMFKFDSTEEGIESVVNALTLPHNVIKDSLAGGASFLAKKLGFDETAEDIQGLKEKSIGQLVTDTFGKIFGWFKKILDIDVKGLIRDFVPDKLEGILGLGPEEEKVIESKEPLTEEQLKEQKRTEVQTKIQEAKDRIARSEAGENVYGSSFGNLAGRESVGQKQDRKLVEQLITELKPLLGSAVAQSNSELADEKRTSTGGVVLNQVDNSTKVDGRGSGGGGIIPVAVKDNSMSGLLSNAF